MRWSVGIEAEGDRVLTREQVVELADAVAASSGIATGIGTNRYGAQLVVEAASREEAIEQATGEFTPAAATAGLPPAPIVRAEAVSEAEDEDEPMIRLGSLAGYPFEGPRLLGGWTAPAGGRGVRDHVQARPGGQAGAARGDLRRARRRPDGRAVPVPAPAGALLDQPGRLPLEGLRLHLRGARRQPGHREQIARELIAVYQPGCNDEQYDQAWKDEWIGGPTTGFAAGRSGGLKPTASCRRERRRPEAGRAPAARPGPRPRRDVGDDLLGHPVQQRQRPGHHAAGPVDVLHAGRMTLAWSTILATMPDAPPGSRRSWSAACPPRTGRTPGPRPAGRSRGRSGRRAGSSGSRRARSPSRGRARPAASPPFGVSAVLDSVFVCPATGCFLLPRQEAALRMHCAHARFVWNLACEQQSWWRPGRANAPGYLRSVQAAHRRATRTCRGCASGSQMVQQQALRDFAQAMAKLLRRHPPQADLAQSWAGTRGSALSRSSLAHVRRLNRKTRRSARPKMRMGAVPLVPRGPRRGQVVPGHLRSGWTAGTSRSPPFPEPSRVRAPARSWASTVA